MAKVYTIHCPNCGLELGKFTTEGSGLKAHCAGCNTIIYIGVSDRKDAAITIQYPLTIRNGNEVELPVNMVETVQYAAYQIVDAAERWADADQTDDHAWTDQDQSLFGAVKEYRRIKDR